MNEWVTLMFAATASDLAASIFLYGRAPQNPLCLMSDGAVVYAVSHFGLALLVWAAAGVAGWFFAGSALLRERQNTSTKMGLLVTLCCVGLFIDVGVALYQASGIPADVARATAFGTVAWGAALRIGCYTLTFWGVVLLAYAAGRMRPAGITPSPRFGRE